ncbi:UNVERIFIED_CONTAM: hypothetical protein FKN15_066806 [Acipenser sinensis]
MQLWAAYRQACRRLASLQGSLVRDELRTPWPTLSPTLGQLCTAPWELSSTVGSGIAWTGTGDLQAIERILHSTWSAFTRCATRESPDPAYLQFTDGSLLSSGSSSSQALHPIQ